MPLILTCDRDLSLTDRFVASYRTVQGGLERPLVVIDTSSSRVLSARYLDLIGSLNPRQVRVHPREAGMDVYESVQEASWFCLRAALEAAGPNDLVLFMEDDIRFSSRFLEALGSLTLDAETGFVSLYLPGDGYGSTTIDPYQFYGTQCLLFPRRPLGDIVSNWDRIRARLRPGYDLRWSRFLSERGYRLRCTDRSYVQHLPSTSRLHRIVWTHTSERFID